MASFDQTPDRPQSFGYRVLWFAIKTASPMSVIDALELGETMSCNWASGLAAAYASKQGNPSWVFVSPPVDGWVLAASAGWPYPTEETHHDIGRKFEVLFSRLAGRFADVQFFGSHRVSGFVTWARALNAKPIRIFGYNDAEVLANVGDQTVEEAELGFADLTGLSVADAGDKIIEIAEEQDAEEDRLVASGLSRRDAHARVRQNGHDAFPDESDVVDLAARWSIDPTQLSDRDLPAGLGLAARLPDDLVQ